MRVVRVVLYCYDCDKHHETEYEEGDALLCPVCSSDNTLLVDVLDVLF